MKTPEDYQIRRNSSVDRIERAGRFLRYATDFEELLDYEDDEETGEYQSLLKRLTDKAMTIIHRESS